MSQLKSGQQELRLIDANYNRCKEGIRVVEDVCRFFLDDEELSRAWKELRHQVTEAILSFPTSYKEIVQSRCVEGDVGREFSLVDDESAESIQKLVFANAQRVQESLRVLEEVSKHCGFSECSRIEKLRFESYELEKRTFTRL